MKTIIFLILLLGIIGMNTGCKPDNTLERSEMDLEKIRENLNKLQNYKIIFGHQSVGFNIMDGVEDLMKQCGMDSFKIIKVDKSIKSVQDFNWAHFEIGKNGEPKAKCDDFEAYVKLESFKEADVLFLKFCYVDIDQETDIQQLFDYYKSKMESLQKRFPQKHFYYMTVPLTVTETGLKATIKKWMGKNLRGEARNSQRHTFNQLLRRHFPANRILDVAQWESTFPDGKTMEFSYKGKKIPRLISEYTYDGGHLNEIGRKIVAARLIQQLSQTLD